MAVRDDERADGLHHRRAGQRADALGGEVGAGQHQRDARHGPRRRGVDRDDPRMRMRRAQRHAMQRAGGDQVRDIAALADEETRILDAAAVLADHGGPPGLGCAIRSLLGCRGECSEGLAAAHGWPRGHTAPRRPFTAASSGPASSRRSPARRTSWRRCPGRDPGMTGVRRDAGGGRKAGWHKPPPLPLRQPPGDEFQPVLAPEDVLADDVGRRAEDAAGERRRGVRLAASPPSADRRRAPGRWRRPARIRRSARPARARSAGFSSILPHRLQHAVGEADGRRVALGLAQADDAGAGQRLGAGEVLRLGLDRDAQSPRASAPVPAAGRPGAAGCAWAAAGRPSRRRWCRNPPARCAWTRHAAPPAPRSAPRRDASRASSARRSSRCAGPSQRSSISGADSGAPVAAWAAAKLIPGASSRTAKPSPVGANRP